jgi:response regulator NasT
MTTGDTSDAALSDAGSGVLDPAPAAEALPPPVKPGQRTVVVAEDEALIRLDIVEMLRDNDFVVVGEAGDGEEAVRLATLHRPDLVVMDIKMPKLDGIQAAEILTQERIAPVLLLTAYSDRELVDRARDAGVVAYLVKPFREADLLPAIEVAMARFVELRALDKQLGDMREAMETRKIVERAKGVLMETQGLSEPEAFRRIQQLSMNTRKPMKEIAQAIILANQLEK